MERLYGSGEGRSCANADLGEQLHFDDSAGGGVPAEATNTMQGLELPARLVPVLRRALLLVTCSSLLLCKYACLLAHTLTRSLAHPLPLSDLLVCRQHSLLLVGVHCLF